MGSCLSSRASADSSEDYSPRRVPRPTRTTPRASSPTPAAAAAAPLEESRAVRPVASRRTTARSQSTGATSPSTDRSGSPSNSRRPSSRSKINAPRRSGNSFMMRPSLNALRTYATLPSPSTSLPASTLLMSTHNTIAIFDAYPKAKYHFLVLPRFPFPPQTHPESTKSLVPTVDLLDDLRSLLTKAPLDVAEQVINSMAETAREVEEMVRDEMVKTEGFEWKVNIGFHAIPSMKHIHLHVISEDRISDSMKSKKHHNSFRPDLGFFVSIHDVQRWFAQDEDYIHARLEALSGTDSLLSSPLTCFKCDEPFHTIPNLKKHLEKEFAKEKATALKRIAMGGPQRSSDEDADAF